MTVGRTFCFEHTDSDDFRHWEFTCVLRHLASSAVYFIKLKCNSYLLLVIVLVSGDVINTVYTKYIYQWVEVYMINQPYFLLMERKCQLSTNFFCKINSPYSRGRNSPCGVQSSNPDTKQICQVIYISPLLYRFATYSRNYRGNLAGVCSIINDFLWYGTKQQY